MLSSHKVTQKYIAIIIVTFNSEKYISNCLRSIIHINNLPNSYNRRIIVIDNNSQDKTVDEIKNIIVQNKNIQLVCNSKNLGFAKAVNLGIKIAPKSDYFLLLNPDTIMGPDSLINLIRCIQKNKAGIAGGSTLNEEGFQNGSYFRFPNIWVGLFDLTNLRKLLYSDHWHNYFYYLDSDSSGLSCFPVDVVTGGYMLITNKTIQKIGNLDQGYFMYLEDVDYCLRAKKAGIKIYHSNKSTIVHFAGRSSENKDRIRHLSWLWSRKLYYIKNLNILENLIIQPIFLVDDLYILVKLFLDK